MALQNSGTITMDDVGSEFGGSKPYRLQDHYRGGSRVRSTIPGNTSPGNPGTTTPGNSGGCFPTGDFGAPETCPEITSPTHGCLNANNPNNPSRSFSCPSGGITTNGCLGGGMSGYSCSISYTYKDAYPGRINGARFRPYVINNPNPPTSNPPNPPTTNPAQPINTGVPTSGTIRLTNFYGSRK